VGKLKHALRMPAQNWLTLQAASSHIKAMPVKPGTLVVQQYDPSILLRQRMFVAAIWIVSLICVYLWCKSTMTPGYARTQQLLSRTQSELLLAQKANEQIKLDVARYQRGEQVAKEALLALQKTLDERLQEVTDLRTDLSFFQRFAGGGNAEALGVQEINVHATSKPNVFKYTIAVSQNLKRGKVVAGALRFSVSGLVAGKPRKLDLPTLLGDAAKKSLSYEFKYFQRFDGTLYLPEGFAPTAIQAHMENTDGESAQKEVSWDNALANRES
jgi:hypothetical protein